MINKSSTTLQSTLRTALTSLVLLAAAGAASAAPVGELYPAGQLAQTAATVKTRAQVIGELVQARAAGQVASGEIGYAFGTPAERNAVGAKSRTEVIAEYRQAAAEGTLVAYGEAVSTQPTRLTGSARSRADVRADAIQSAHSNAAAGNTFSGN